jgi:hypothetical protein
MFWNSSGNKNIALGVRAFAVLGFSKFFIIGKKGYDARPEVGAKNYIEVVKLPMIDPVKFFEEQGLNPVLVEQKGFALEECLATNTPIYVYDVTSMKDEYVNGTYPYQHHSQQMLATSAPYWNEQCGMKVTSNQEFEDRFQYFINALPNYQPARYANSILSDQVCFQRLLDRLNLK